MPLWKTVPQEIRDRFPAPPDRSDFASEDGFEEALGYWQSHTGRRVSLAMQALRKTPETPRRLIYRVVPHNGGLVFAEQERAEHIARIHQAINTSKTWGEFRRAMPAEEYEKILRSIVDIDDPDSSPPEDGDSFSGEAVPGWSDGDYPAWLQRELDQVLPHAVLAEFGRRESTMLNGSYWDIPKTKSKELCAALTALGFELELRQDLPFH